jgi:hypothetical protein
MSGIHYSSNIMSDLKRPFREVSMCESSRLFKRLSEDSDTDDCVEDLDTLTSNAESVFSAIHTFLLWTKQHDYRVPFKLNDWPCRATFLRIETHAEDGVFFVFRMHGNTKSDGHIIHLSNHSPLTDLQSSTWGSGFFNFSQSTLCSPFSNFRLPKMIAMLGDLRELFFLNSFLPNSIWEIVIAYTIFPRVEYPTYEEITYDRDPRASW